MAGKVYTWQYQVSPRSTRVCFIFFAFLSSAKLRQFHFCRTTSNRPKNPLGTHSPNKGTCERSERLKAEGMEGFAPCCQVCAVNPSCRDLQRQQNGTALGVTPQLTRSCYWGMVRTMAGGQPALLKLRGWTHIPLTWESNAASVILTSSHSDLVKSPKNLKKKPPCFSPDCFSPFPLCCLPYCTATFNPILLYGAETNKALA